MNGVPSTACAYCTGLLASPGAVPWNQVLHDGGDFIVAPSKGSIVPGWLLVVAKRHVLCAGALASSELEALTSTLRKARAAVQQEYGNVTLFEHGPSSRASELGCGIDHMHLHVVPLPFSLMKAVDELFPGMQWFGAYGLEHSRLMHASGRGYIAIKEPHSPKWVFAEPVSPTRQMVRQAIAHTLGKPSEFDYATHPFTPNVVETIEVLSPLL